ncbi:beta-glucosidase 12 [Cryptomeria japonica]|uniref:beta-glucosidase 12 n=1 Tax=Cryptomeria japonica TaxID=3369 RepID=UPI0025AD1DA8|nr:beta-glucosidase 12 [Cryptomeria japonica]
MKIFRVCVIVFCYLGALSLVTGYTQFGKKAFPSDFVFGLGSAAYQYEGAAGEDEEGKSIWDTFAHTPGKIADNSNGDVANDQYHRYKDDVKLLADLGVDSYRFSIAWTRIFPNGRGEVNKKGIAYYNNLIDELLKHGIRPFVTIFHWDLPQVLQDEYGGFLSEKIIKDFVNYAYVCFNAFGDRVKNWVTINELISISMYGYNYGSFAPGRCSKSVGNCSAGNSAIETYIVAHNLLLSHAAAVKLYRDKYQKTQKGSIGITLATHWFLPHSNSLVDGNASRRALDFFFGWYTDPLVRGEYPASMRAMLGARLPRFTQAQSNQVKGSFDFLGINYYTGMYTIHDSAVQNPMNNNFTQDARIILVYERNGILIGPQGGADWLHLYPRGIRELLNYIKHNYNNPPVYITENGIDDSYNSSMTMQERLNDTWRINYHSKHLLNLALAIKDGCNVKGYYGWTFMDDFEWNGGYESKMGFYYVDRANNLTRHARASAHWLKDFLHN